MLPDTGLELLGALNPTDAPTARSRLAPLDRRTAIRVAIRLTPCPALAGRKLRVYVQRADPNVSVFGSKVESEITLPVLEQARAVPEHVRNCDDGTRIVDGRREPSPGGIAPTRGERLRPRRLHRGAGRIAVASPGILRVFGVRADPVTQIVLRAATRIAARALSSGAAARGAGHQEAQEADPCEDAPTHPAGEPRLRTRASIHLSPRGPHVACHNPLPDGRRQGGAPIADVREPAC